jgi:hypothetical protein
MGWKAEWIELPAELGAVCVAYVHSRPKESVDVEKLFLSVPCSWSRASADSGMPGSGAEASRNLVKVAGVSEWSSFERSDSRLARVSIGVFFSAFVILLVHHLDPAVVW